MRLILDMREAEAAPSVLALGMFDGVHLGHDELLSTAMEVAQDNDLRFDIFTFQNHPGTVLGVAPPQITTFRTKITLLAEREPDTLLVPRFTAQMARMEPEMFVRWLIEATGARCLVAGENYTFGHRGRGDARKLVSLSRRMGADAVIVKPVTGADGAPISSTAIREAIARGDVGAAAMALGMPVTLTGRVEHGRRLGRTLGLPTINIAYDPLQCLPRDGVYMALVDNGVMEYTAVLNIGTNPTVGGDTRTVEAHLIGYRGVMYGRYARVTVIKRLRDEMRFKSVQELKKQIESDVDRTLTYFAELLLNTD